MYSTAFFCSGRFSKPGVGRRTSAAVPEGTTVAPAAAADKPTTKVCIFNLFSIFGDHIKQNLSCHNYILANNYSEIYISKTL